MTEPTPRPTCPPVPLPALAEALGVSMRTLQRRQAEGVIRPAVEARGRRGALYAPLDVARVLLGQPDDPREAKDRSVAEWNQLRIAERRRELLPRAEVVRAGVGICRAATTRMLRVTSDLERAGVAPETVRLVGAAVAEALDDLAGLERLAEEVR